MHAKEIMEKPLQVDIMNLRQVTQSSKNIGMKSHAIVVKQKQEQQQLWESIDPCKLVLGKVVGRGAFGVVHKGSYHGQTVAVKISAITKASMEFMKISFKNEVILWCNLDHPNITKMIGATMLMKTNTNWRKNKKSETTSNLCIVSEYLKGGSLRAYLEKNRNKKLPMQMVTRIALDIARGLSYLHSKKIIHLDIKPENMLIDKDQTIKLADFGESVFEEELCHMSGKVGTLGYMAPEVFSSKGYGHKCDVYSFGICLWEIYSCDMAYTYDLDNLSDYIYEITRPSIPANCPRSLARLMERCWDADLEKRPEMTSVISELEEMAKSEGWQTMSEDQKEVAGCFCFFKYGR